MKLLILVSVSLFVLMICAVGFVLRVKHRQDASRDHLIFLVKDDRFRSGFKMKLGQISGSINEQASASMERTGLPLAALRLTGSERDALLNFINSWTGDSVYPASDIFVNLNKSGFSSLTVDFGLYGIAYIPFGDGFHDLHRIFIFKIDGFYIYKN